MLKEFFKINETVVNKENETELELHKKLRKLRATRNMLIPRPRKKIFSKYSLKNDITVRQAMSIENIDHEIKEIEKKIRYLIINNRIPKRIVLGEEKNNPLYIKLVSSQK